MVAVPAQDAHMEKRAQEVSEKLGKEGNNDDILQARIYAVALIFQLEHSVFFSLQHASSLCLSDLSLLT